MWCSTSTMTILAIDPAANGKLLRIGHQVEPGRTLDIGRDYVGKSRLELANSAADFERRPANAGRCDAIVNVIVDPAQKRLLIPRQPIFDRADRSLKTP